MERLDAILNNEIFREEMRRLNRLEQERIYCRHGMQHLLDVARAAWILALERGASHKKDLVYAAALLHDIGRAVQYESGIPHEQSGVPLAEHILRETAFDGEERQTILDCIARHRLGAENGTSLPELISEADKLSRACFDCAASDTCKWKEEQKNLSLTI